MMISQGCMYPGSCQRRIFSAAHANGLYVLHYSPRRTTCLLELILHAKKSQLHRQVINSHNWHKRSMYEERLELENTAEALLV